MRRLPLAIGIPLLSAALVVGIAWFMGRGFLYLNDEYSPDHALVAALAVSLLILGGAVVLSIMDSKRPEPTPSGVKSSTTGLGAAPQANPRDKGDERRRGGSGRRRR